MSPSISLSRERSKEKVSFQSPHHLNDVLRSVIIHDKYKQFYKLDLAYLHQYFLLLLLASKHLTNVIEIISIWQS
jgi:hypothetical protein